MPAGKTAVCIMMFMREIGPAANLCEEINVIRGLEFDPTAGGEDAVRILSGGSTAVEDCRFIRVSGMAIVATHTSVRGLAVRRSVIPDTKGPGIMVHGSRDLANVSLVERNVTTRSRTSSGIVLGGGAGRRPQ